jgi:hypothetical protein
MTDSSSKLVQGATHHTYFDYQGNYQSQGELLDPAFAGDDLATLSGFLERQRATFAWKTGGLDATGLQARLGASPMTLGGLLKHLARFEDDMSTEWLQGKPQLAPWNEVDWDNDHDWDWRSAAQDPPEQLYSMWQDAVNRSRSLFAQALEHEVDERASTGDANWREGAPSLAYILANMVEEYARHNGHADLLRESVDGLVGHDPPA